MNTANRTPTVAHPSSLLDALRRAHISQELAFGAGFLLLIVAVSIAIVSIPA
jgi:hypothetical protein